MAQTQANNTSTDTKRIAYIIVNFDDQIHEYADRYQVQINKFIANNPTPRLEVRFDIKEAYYTAKA